MTCRILVTTRLTKSQFADDAGQWAASKNIDLAAEYLQRDLDKSARWCAKWRIKLNSEKIKVIIFSKSQTATREKSALSLYGELLSYHPHIKFLGITFDNRMTFTKHFEEILERCNHKFHRLRIVVNKKWRPSLTTILQIYKQCVRPIFEYGIVFTITISESFINKIQRVQNSFIRLALRLPKYVSARLLHEALCTFRILGGWQAVSLEGGVTVMEKREILAGWVTNVCLKCTKKAGVGRVTFDNIFKSS